jgi:hypothetical protein
MFTLFPSLLIVWAGLHDDDPRKFHFSVFFSLFRSVCMILSESELARASAMALGRVGPRIYILSGSGSRF